LETGEWPLLGHGSADTSCKFSTRYLEFIRGLLAMHGQFQYTDGFVIDFDRHGVGVAVLAAVRQRKLRRTPGSETVTRGPFQLERCRRVWGGRDHLAGEADEIAALRGGWSRQCLSLNFGGEGE
jgi:hypothetical protein